MKEPSAKKIYKYIDKFTNIYEDNKEVNPIPSNVKVTVWCESDDEDGFVYDTYLNDMGLEELIAKKWILQSYLIELLD